MRTTRDRIRHAVGFEVVGLLIFAPLASWAFGYELHEMGVIGAVASLIATGWNYLYNLLFDKAMLRITGQVRKSVMVRVLHAILFELGLLVVFLPALAWYLNISLIDALIMDIAVAVFYMAYALVYNWLYDIVFPVPSLKQAAARPDGVAAG
ncbi:MULTISPECIES: PACE efflux transporter [unclassified Cupriavidus]|uniref:PACE efflux transporter n=1 Tax=unclassified Cupriavidus TaxID=2640874 RepID=UPI00040D80D4|nr:MULTISPECIES: PACE efflux transporter [unclassified Cupriavidus]MBP0627547.1 PACE efflux transporter [Cupriavidus sp. AcVe19-1a]MBP0635796.1 PACE efflux transporter [Cupriavidus sp. AcVe19-6a]